MLEKLKQKLRNWLEVPVPMTEIELRWEIGRVFVDVLNGEYDDSWQYNARNAFLEQLDIEVKRATLEHSTAVASLTAQEHIKGEEFIDEIVARIQRKQLN